jgi:putative ABC transport system ATP-binding protein
MVTHSMRQALDFGSRLIMLHQGRIMLDIGADERRSMKVEDLLQLFRRKEGKDLSDDQLLLG